MKSEEINRNNYCVILAGGIGSRLWPSSRQEKPKQFVDVLSCGETLLQSTFRRYSRFIAKENIFVVISAQHQPLVHEQLPELCDDNCLIEPMRRNTVPCSTWATRLVYEKNKDACVVVTPADQLIENEDAFEKDILKGLEYVSTHNRLLSIGVSPTYPDTNYGYIQMADAKATDIYSVKSFSEKPDVEFARTFLDSGEFLWNSGLFLFSASTYIKTLSTVVDDLSFMRCPNSSLEQLILEKKNNVDVMCCHFGWKDIGTWGELYDLMPKNEVDNVVIDSGSMLYNCNGCIIKAPKGMVVVAQDLKDYVIIADKGVLMICKKDDQKTIRKFVNDYDLKFNS